MTKRELRDQFRAYRAALSEAAYVAKSTAIVTHLLALPAIQHATIIHVYWPLTARREVDTRLLIEQLDGLQKQIVMPVVANFSRPGAPLPLLEHRRYHPADLCAPNKWGLREPLGGEAVPVATLDVIVVPALGAGRNGHRIGHGFGYYDAFLQQAHATTYCLVYDACVVEAVPNEPHDQRMDYLVTESGVWPVP